jgi:Chlorophyll A-B binding protein
MKTAAVLASLVASAAAFAPSSQVAKSSTSLKAFENEIGAQPPLGFYDPLGLLANADQERFDKLRYVELKHGRVSQLAFVGYLVPKAGYHLPGDIDLEGNAFASFPSGLAAVNGPDAISVPGLLQVLAFIAFLEFRVMQDVTGQGQFLGDFRNGFDFGWDKQSAEWQTKKRAVELNQGRAAMMGILGLMVHEQLGGSLPIVGEM